MNNLGVMRPNLILVTIIIKWKDPNKKPQTIQFVTTSGVIKSGFNHTFTRDAAVAAATAWNRGLSGGVDNALAAAVFGGFAEEAKAAQNTLRRLSRTEISGLMDDILKLFKDHPGCEDSINKIARRDEKFEQIRQHPRHHRELSEERDSLY